jgi:DNA-directed RNA polymerase subunit RPC12/RpoP
MAEPADAATTYNVVCPHCRKEFRSELLSGGAERYKGFKCPHCRLFVSLERVEEQTNGKPGAP